MSTPKNKNVDVINIIQRMMSAAGVKSEAQLMKYIGNNERGASTRWKERGAIPEGAIRVLYLQSGVRREWIETGEGPMRDEPPEVPQQIKEGQGDYFSATTQKIALMVEAMDEEARKDICLSVEKEKLLRELLRQRASDEKAG